MPKRNTTQPAEVVPNSAVEPEPTALEPREYEVTGNQKILGNTPGTKFAAVIPPDQEARLIRRGQIKPVEGDNNPPKEG